MKKLINNKYFKCFFSLICIILCNNISFLVKYINFHVIDIVFINLNIVISFIVVLLIFIFNNLLTKNKKGILFSIIFSYNIISNLSSHINALGFLLLYLFILLITYCFMLKFNSNFEISLISSITLLILIFIFIGILNLLKFGILIIIGLCVICFYFIFKNKNKLFSEEFFTDKGFKIFSILYIIAIIGGVGRYVHIWDEYSYWAYAAKVTINMDSIKNLITYAGNYR